MERTVRFNQHKCSFNNNLNELLQFVCIYGHNIDTVLVRVKKDIVMPTDQSKLILLVLLDLSAAFDKVDDNVLFSRLKHMVKYVNCSDPIWDNALR